MIWFNDKRQNITGLQCANPYSSKYILRLCVNNKNIINDGAGELDEDDVRYILKRVNNIPTLADIKNILLSLQVEYDKCYEVNSFYIDGIRCWFDKATRVGLTNAINLQKQLGNTTYKVWFGDNIIELEIDRALTLLANIENYAGQCYNVTQEHISEINNLSTIEDCLNYDITAGYPDILNITLK